MAKKELKEVSMELTYSERDTLNEIQYSREALTELQNTLIPFAKKMVREQRIWWDRVLESRGLTRKGAGYAIQNGRTIVNQQEEVK